MNRRVSMIECENFDCSFERFKNLTRITLEQLERPFQSLKVKYVVILQMLTLHIIDLMLLVSTLSLRDLENLTISLMLK